ncbi:MAG: STAS domain-containing protein [Sulfuricellaceae bacterium]|jgi:anti-anti-sigma factor
MFQSQCEEGKLRVAFSGRMDTTQSTAIQEELLARVTATPLPVVFDLKDVEFVASAFLRLCLSTAQRVGANRLTLANASPAVRKVFAIAGLDRHFHME